MNFYGELSALLLIFIKPAYVQRKTDKSSFEWLLYTNLGVL